MPVKHIPEILINLPFRLLIVELQLGNKEQAVLWTAAVVVQFDAVPFILCGGMGET